MPNLYWIVPSVIATIVSGITGYYQFHKFVKATLTVPYMEKEVADENEMTYKIGVLVNNKGNLPIHISDATLFVEDNKGKLDDITFDNLKINPIENNVVMPNDMRSFSLHAKINKEWFYRNSQLAQEEYGGKPAVFKIQVGVILTGGDSKNWRAISDIGITSIGKNHITPELNFKSAEFEEFDPNKPEIKYQQ